ncbi:MAG: hypothetical protein KUA43_00345 [Hoeflea sp.]|uniref:hypothetical protein n=1 Tax=Hoeflea sp. TaxID=1940281 RepID=UPI001D86C3B0|nr:hypothetical protein [Hoeflea sp.]MBU4530287.1 hypothetical protein [Alphaproteobacteria bacterium]MBU4545074.1 hypothetical protein [Alphaproteobacteria bacterium]MBU4549726.1 hypothetical protein [Alphaproteobacteria bacterium]MBV1721877.1 hypothetical protein [Hoeflea sp.]MBV1761227.1 hypothetical protein [Hoeflea sp.]
MANFDFGKATAELPILRDFIDFVNKQSSVYMDCLNGFAGNTVRIERQVARVTFPARKELRDGQDVVVWDSMEDPSKPDIIHNSIRKSSTYLADNSETGFNEQQICWAIIVFMFAHWDEEVRPAIAEVREVEPNDIKIDALGDLRILRKAVVHAKGIVTAVEHAKLKKMMELVKPDETLALSHDQMHKVFVMVKNAIGQIVMHYTGGLSGAPSADKIVDIAIQNVCPSRERRDV